MVFLILCFSPFAPSLSYVLSKTICFYTLKSSAEDENEELWKPVVY